MEKNTTLPTILGVTATSLIGGAPCYHGNVNRTRELANGYSELLPLKSTMVSVHGLVPFSVPNQMFYGYGLVGLVPGLKLLIQALKRQRRH